MCPEIHFNEAYDLTKADLFAAGVILFNMVTGIPPFSKAVKSDTLYRCFAMDRIDLFWKVHERKIQKPLSEGLKNLITRML